MKGVQLQPRALVTQIGGGARLAHVDKYRVTLLLGVGKLRFVTAQNLAQIINALGWNISCSKRHFIFSINSSCRATRPESRTALAPPDCPLASLPVASRHRQT